jgi:hypothetical protein
MPFFLFLPELQLNCVHDVLPITGSLYGVLTSIVPVGYGMLSLDRSSITCEACGLWTGGWTDALGRQYE